MSPQRGGLPAFLALAGASAATAWLAMWSWRGFTEETGGFLVPLLGLAVAVAVCGAVGRWARLPSALVVGVQVLVAGALAGALICGSPVPVGSAWDRLIDAFAGAVATAQTYPAPVPGTAELGVEPLLIAGGLLCLLLVDLFAGTLRRVPLAGLPLLAIYSVPVSMVINGVTWWVFAMTAAGFLLMLFLQVNDQLARWGRPLGDAEADPGAFGVTTGAIRGTAGTIGVSATALAIFLPLVIPTLDLNILGGGSGPGDGDITVENPMTDLRRDLQRGDDIPLVQIQTKDKDPEYLRISVLNRFSDNEWSSGNREVPTNQLAAGDLPALPGVAGTVARTETRYDVTVLPSFRSTWLPTQAPISSINASGDWRYDVSTRDFLAGSKGLTTAGLSYSMTAVDLDLSAESMARAPSGGSQVGSEFLDLPDGLPSAVTNLAFQVTRNAPTRLEKAQVLQDWFRQDGGFTYDIDADEGNGTDDLVRFLTNGQGGRTGYCEQFASAMAVMARSLGIPARVAVGFLSPTRIGQDRYEYSAWDLHAWPELFFPGSGWVRFEPTPPGRASGVPRYTTEQVAAPDNPGAPEIPRGDDQLPSRGASESPSATESEAAASDGGGGGGLPLAPMAGSLGGGLVLVGLLLLPRAVRRRRTRSRLGAGPEAAWLELQETALDLGVVWPQGRSPRETRDSLLPHLGAPVDANTPDRPPHGPEVNPDAVSALGLIVLAVEQGRYAREAEHPRPPLRAELMTVTEALLGGATRGARRRAEWLPRSVLRRRARSGRSSGAPFTVRHGAVVDHVG